MDFNETKKIMREKYLEKGFKLKDEDEETITMLYGTNEYVIIKDDISEYLKYLNEKNSYQITPCETSVCSNLYREQLVSSIDIRRAPVDMFFRDQTPCFGEKSEEKIHVELGSASNLFINVNRFNDDVLSRFTLYSGVTRDTSGKINDIRGIYSRLITIKVYNIGADTIDEAEKISSKKVEDALFELSYMKNIPIWVVDEFPYKRSSRLEKFRYNEIYPNWNFPLKTSYNSDLIRFYQFAMSTNIPEFQFLSYYHILEYFFITVNNEKLYDMIEKRIKDPRFTFTEKYYGFLIQDIMNNKQETDEKVMLKNVLEKYIDKAELKIFIESYEKHLGDKIYTKKHDVFGVQLQVILEKDHIIGNIAVHIKEIRNALVHSSEKYLIGTRYVPLTKSSKELSKEIPLMKFLAEKIIIATSIPIEE